MLSLPFFYYFYLFIYVGLLYPLCADYLGGLRGRGVGQGGPKNDAKNEVHLCLEVEKSLGAEKQECKELAVVLLQATKNKTYTPKNICSSASKDHSHGEYLA